jgi:hypothetical protein
MRRRVWRHGTVSAVGFGAMSFGGFYGPTNEADSMRTLVELPTFEEADAWVKAWSLYVALGKRQQKEAAKASAS